VNSHRIPCVASWIIVSSIIALSVGAAEIRIVPAKPVKIVTDLAHIEITGEIVKSDAEKLQKALAQFIASSVPDANPIVILDSPGGNVAVALEMGRILRHSLAHTAVTQDGTCGSSCVFVFAGGVMRDIYSNGQLGLHRPRFDYDSFADLPKDQAMAAYSAAVSKCADFMKEMGIPEQVLSHMLRVPSQQVTLLNRERAEKYGLVGTDPAWEEWQRARDVKAWGEAWVKARDRLLECLNSGRDDKQCLERYNEELEQIEKQNRR
jgi:hypothetical protein